MGWTSPRTWVTDELVTAAIMNTHVRDNFNSISHLIARKTADESVTSSTTLQDDNDLIAPVGVNEVWQFTWYLIFKASTAGDMKFAFTFPSGGDISYAWVWPDSSGVYAAITNHIQTGTSPTTAKDIVGTGTEFNGPVPINMMYVGGANAGNVTLQWAQQTSDATATIMRTNSTVWGAKLA